VRQDLSGATDQLKDNLAAESDHAQPDEQGGGDEVDQAALDAQRRSIKQRFLDDRERRRIGGWGRKWRPYVFELPWSNWQARELSRRE
jgi:hypothetical protein